MYEQFTNKYRILKTLKFGLIPQGETLRYIEENGIIEDDTVRAETAKKVKALADRYHKDFINSVLSSLKLDGIEKYEDAYRGLDIADGSAALRDMYAADLRKQIAKAFSSDRHFNDMFKSKMYSVLLPDYFAYDSEALELLESFNGFASYFSTYNMMRKRIYEASDENDRPKRGTISSRIIDDNLPIFLGNSYRLSYIAECEPTIIEQTEQWLGELLGITSLSDAFASANYSRYLTQHGIDRYNQLIGGITWDESGTRIRGLNELINEYNQRSDKARRLPLLVPLKNQILSERTSLSFIPESFDDDDEVRDAIRTFDAVFSAGVSAAVDTLRHISDYDTDHIYIKTKCIREISGKVCRSWHFAGDLLAEKHDTAGSKGAKRRGREEIGSYSLGEIDSLPGIDGKFSKYLSGAIGFSGIEYERTRRELFDRFDTKTRDARSLKSDDRIKTEIKAYMDAALEIRDMVSVFDTERVDTDSEFLSKINEVLDAVMPAATIYNKTRNYLTAKPYKNDKIKLNFGASEFLGGWAESRENICLGTLLLRNGRYYLGVIAKGCGNPFANAPDAETDDVYMKMCYNQISNPARDLPHAAFSARGIKKMQPDPAALEAYWNKTYIVGKDFSLEGCHALIDYYKRCTEEYPNWQVYDFHFKETGKYNGIREFFDDVSKGAYSMRFKPIDRKVIDELVESGKLYLFEIWHKDFSDKAYGRPDLSTMYWKALFTPENLESSVYRLNGGAEMFFRKASIREEDIIRHRAGDTVMAKNPLNERRSRVLKYDIIKDRRYTVDHFQLNIPITINADSPEFTSLNVEARKALKAASDPHVIGVSRGENSLIHITVVDSEGRIVESRSLNIIESGKNRTDYGALLAAREAERNDARKNWASIAGIKQLKEGYIGQVVHILADLMIRYDAVIAIEDLGVNFKMIRQKIERAVYRRFEEKLIRKLNFLVSKDADPDEPGGVYRGYQLTLPFQSASKLGKQTGFIFYVSPWKTTAIDPVTGFVNLLDTSYTSVADAVDFWSAFDRISIDKKTGCCRFDMDYENMPLTEERRAFLAGTRTEWSVYLKGKRVAKLRTGSGVRYKEIDLREAVRDLFDKYCIGGETDLRDEICAVKDKAFHEKLLELFALAVGFRSSDGIESPVADANGNFYTGQPDELGSYNIALKGLMLVKRIKNASDEQITAKGKSGVPMVITANEWLRFVQSDKAGEA